MEIKMNRKPAILGMVAPIIYVFHVVYGGLLWAGYSHIRQPISDLSATGAPDRDLLQGILYIYGILLVIFTIYAFLYFKKSDNKTIKVAMAIFITAQIVSISYGFFPEDLSGAEATFTGTMHLVVTGLIVPLTILTPFVSGIAFRKIEGFRSLSLYSYITTAIIFFVGGLTVILMANKSEVFGLFERINIGSYQLWIFIFALKLFRRKYRNN
jgi:hypothetical membrane protein